MTSDDYFRTQLLLRSRDLFQLEGLGANEQFLASHVLLIMKAAIGYCDQKFFMVLVRRLNENLDVPALEPATKALFQAVERNDSKEDVAEAAVALVFAAWQRGGSILIEVVGQALVNQVRYENHFCQSCSTGIKDGAASPYCEQHEARLEFAAEHTEREAQEGWEKMTPAQRAEMDEMLRQAEQDQDEYTRDRVDEILA